MGDVEVWMPFFLFLSASFSFRAVGASLTGGVLLLFHTRTARIHLFDDLLWGYPIKPINATDASLRKLPIRLVL